MGCDIHLFAEARDDEGQWQIVEEPIVTCWSCKGRGVYNRESHPYADEDLMGKPCYWCASKTTEVWDSKLEKEVLVPDSRYVEPGKTRESWFHDRNYVVFSVLADVRNGIRGNPYLPEDKPNGHYVEPISEPRGFPDDLSEGGLAWLDMRGGDHSDSWLDLMEVLAHDWKGTLCVDAGVVDAFGYRQYKAQGYPESWCGSAGGGRVRHISNKEMEQKIAAGFFDLASFDGNSWDTPTAADGLSYYTHITWTRSIEQTTKPFVDAMKRLALFVGERETRIVFNFDS